MQLFASLIITTFERQAKGHIWAIDEVTTSTTEAATSDALSPAIAAEAVTTTTNSICYGQRETYRHPAQHKGVYSTADDIRVGME